MAGLIDRDSRPLSPDHQIINKVLSSGDIVTLTGSALARRGVEAIYVEYNWQEGSTHSVHSTESIERIVLDSTTGHMRMYPNNPAKRTKSFHARYLLDVTFIETAHLTKARPNVDPDIRRVI